MDSHGAAERAKVVHGLVERLAQAADMEGWGLVVEAAEEYQSTMRRIKSILSDHSQIFSLDEREFLTGVGENLRLRVTALQDPSSVQEGSSIHALDVNGVLTVLRKMEAGGNLCDSDLTDVLPLSLPVTARPPPEAKKQSSLEDSSGEGLPTAGSLVSRKTNLRGHTYLTITVDKIGLKDPHNCIDPFITVSVKTVSGADVERSQDTPVSSQRDSSALLFGTDVDIHTPIDTLPTGSAIFLELKHYKPKKSIISTKCFSFMEMDEIKPGRAVLEIYRKPTDFRRKKLSLLSSKPLYLHVTLKLHNT